VISAAGGGGEEESQSKREREEKRGSLGTDSGKRPETNGPESMNYRMLAGKKEKSPTEEKGRFLLNVSGRGTIKSASDEGRT